MVPSDSDLLARFPAYGQSPERVNLTVAQLYAPGAVFKDPLSIAKGQDEIIPLFQAVQAAFQSASCSVLSITESEAQVPTQHPSGAKVILIEAVHKFQLKSSAFTMPFRTLFGDHISYRAITKYILDADGRVLLHEEMWNVSELFAYLPLGLGMAYDTWRLAMAKVWNTPVGKWLLKAGT